MRIVCPHCHNSIEVLTGPPLEEGVLCPSCGSSFRLEAGGSTAGWSPGEAGRKLGRFELIDRVGVGAFGTVYKARDPELDRTVAIKVPRAGCLHGPEDMDRFLREARSVAQLSHPSIVAVHEVGQHDGLPYLVSDFVHGVTLADLLTGRRPSPNEAARIVRAVAEALAYAHGCGVVHRDIKPSNILLDDGGTPRLTDFGLAKRDAGEITLTVEGQVLGTPAYMSPEQARGEGHQVDGRSDVFSLGVVFYQLLTGELPFRGNARMLMHQVINDDPRAPRSLNDRVPRDLETVCLKAMAKERSRRYQSAGEFADDLGRALNHQPILARPPSRWYRLRTFATRNQALVGGALATLAALLLGLAATSAALVKARQEREHARSAERARTLELAHVSAHAARLAAGRGEWERAITHYDEALRLGHEDEVGLRLGRLDCYVALHQYDLFFAELEGLAGRGDLGPHEGPVRLWQAQAALFSRARAGGDPVALMRRALAAKDLPGADRAYARAFLATSSPEAVASLQEAVAEDPFHPRAYELLTQLLLLLGRVGEARQTLDRARMIRPNAANLLATEAVLLALEGNLAGAEQRLDRLAPDLSPDNAEVLRRLLKLYAPLRREEFYWQEPDLRARFALLTDLGALTHHLARALREPTRRRPTLWSEFPLMQLPFFKPVEELSVFMRLDRAEPGVLMNLLSDLLLIGPLLETVARANPEGTLYFLHGNMLQSAGRLREAEQSYRLAVATPALTPCRRRALFELVRVQWRLAGATTTPEGKAWAAKALDNLRRLHAQGPVPPWASAALTRVALGADEPVLALALIEDWQRRAPDDLNALKLRVLAEANLGACERALATAREAARKGPDRGDVEDVQADAGRRLEALKAVLPVLEAKLRLRRAFRLAWAGDHAAAVAQAETDAGKDTDGPALYALACVHALASEAAGVDKGPPADERRRQAERYAARAVRLLAQARTKGHFADAHRLAHFRADADLAALRSRPDFLALAAGLGRR